MVYAEERAENLFYMAHSERAGEVMSKAAVDSLYTFFSTIKSYRSGSPDLAKGAILVEVLPKEGTRYAYLIGADGCMKFINGMPGHAFFVRGTSFPKKMKSEIQAFIDRYKRLMSCYLPLKRYDHLPMNLSMTRPSKCNIGLLSKGVVFNIRFVVLKDSTYVLPIEYSVLCTKRNGIKKVDRYIELWGEEPYGGTNARGLLLALRPSDGRIVARGPATDDETSNLINRYIPKWSQMSNQERMRFLDDILEKSLIQIKQ